MILPAMQWKDLIKYLDSGQCTVKNVILCRWPLGYITMYTREILIIIVMHVEYKSVTVWHFVCYRFFSLSFFSD